MHDITSSVNDCFGKLSENDVLCKLHNGIFGVSKTHINTKSFPRDSGVESFRGSPMGRENPFSPR